jgi:hypothetical protein
MTTSTTPMSTMLALSQAGSGLDWGVLALIVMLAAGSAKGRVGGGKGRR